MTPPVNIAAPRINFKINETQTTLTNRQLEVSCLVCLGLTDKQIARVIDVEPSTVKAHVDDSKERLGVRSRPALVCQLWLRGIVSLCLYAWLGMSPLVPELLGDEGSEIARRVRSGSQRVRGQSARGRPLRELEYLIDGLEIQFDGPHIKDQQVA